MSNEILDLLKVIESDLKDIKENTRKYNKLLLENKIKKEESILQLFREEDSVPSDNAEELTVTEWLMKYHKLQFNDSARRSFSLLVSQTYESIKGTKPKKINKINDTGKPSNGVSVYHESEFPILQLCLNKVIFNSSATLN